MPCSITSVLDKDNTSAHSLSLMAVSCVIRNCKLTSFDFPILGGLPVRGLISSPHFCHCINYNICHCKKSTPFSKYFCTNKAPCFYAECYLSPSELRTAIWLKLTWKNLNVTVYWITLLVIVSISWHLSRCMVQYPCWFVEVVSRNRLFKCPKFGHLVVCISLYSSLL